MQPYQEEYIANLRQIADLTQWKKPEQTSFEEYCAHLRRSEIQAAQMAKRNVELLRSCLFPELDELFQADAGTVCELEEFSAQLYDARRELDVGLFCQIRQALLTLARQKKDRAAMVRHLYWLGMGRNCLCGKLVGIPFENIAKYMTRMRLCFTEAAAYLKYYDQIEDIETRGYILRSRANIALGQFASPGEKIRLIKGTLQILQDKDYQEKAPSLPWDRFIYLTHQNMASSISYSREKVMTPQDMADIMESAYIVYQRRFEEEEMQGRQPPAKSAFAYHAIEYYCGLYDLDTLLSKAESLLDAADPADYSNDGMYSMISLPAFYGQYLQQYPDHIPRRKEYVEGLYRRMLDYVDSFPSPFGNSALFLYLRQLSHTFVATDSSIPYSDFLQRILLRFVPEVYVHSNVVGAGARALCALIMDEEPTFFDDIAFIRAIKNPAKKRAAVLDYAMGCGAFHDAGKSNMIELYSQTARQWFEEEYEMARLHTIAGVELLSSRPSTSRYAAAALGHHAWYDGSHSAPSTYTRLECPERQMVDVIALVDWLESTTHSSAIYMGAEKTFDEAVQAAVELEGKRFSPLLTARLRDGGAAAQIKRAFGEGRRDAYRRMYDDARRSQSPPAS